MSRIWHPWDKWEDYRYNFYGGEADESGPKKQVLELYASLLRNLDQFEAALKVITTEWKHACEQNLTHEGMNRIAYLGQAACALCHRVPNHISSAGYNLLNSEEQYAADAMAKKYLDIWSAKHKEETGNDVATQEIYRR